MNEKVMGICYIVVAVLILVVKYAVPQFFDVLIWLVAIGLLIGGIYFLLKE
jgi:hypothetical protein